jgi:hypothetical protein
MKRNKYLLLLMTITACVMAVIVQAVRAQEEGPGQSDQANLSRPNKVYLARVGRSSTYTVSGRVTDSQGNPLQGVTITSDSGLTTTTNSKGSYSLEGLWTGPNALTAAGTNLLFDPAVQELNVTKNIGGVNFTGSPVTELIVNGGFENNSGWVIPVTEYKAGYSLTQAHSGSRSMRTGIVASADNRYSYSSTSQAITIPSNATTARLYIWLFPQTTEAMTALSAEFQAGEKPNFSEATESSDAQYVLILDQNGNVLETLIWMRSDNRYWTQHQFNLTRWAGRTIQVHIGTYNDGKGGVTALYADDVSVQVTSDTTPPPQVCANALSNSGFESNTAWNIPITAYTAGYSTVRFKNGARSMRTGIVNVADNRYAYSDAWQYATIPSNAVNARLKMWYYPISGEVAALGNGLVEATPPPLPKARTLEEFYDTVNSEDAQYVLVLDTNGYILDYLLWFKSNAQAWKYIEVDMLKYKGKTIRLQFGTYNDGKDGVSALYVDDMFVDYCTGNPEPPITNCTNMIKNGGFESTANWVIPITEYSAGYSTAIFRSGARSMRTGIYYQSHNRYAYSDFRQAVTLPKTVSKALLSFYIYPRTNDFNRDVQYVLILDQWGNWIDTLVWQLKNQGWVYKEFGLKHYAGETIQINFGTYNDGANGVSSMYVDDVKFDVCP